MDFLPDHSMHHKALSEGGTNERNSVADVLFPSLQELMPGACGLDSITPFNE
jgi:hypothetical protein